MELAIGQSLRQGSVGVWNAIHPYLGGVGFGSVVISLLVGVYYNMIIAWCFFYLFASFQDPLPYANCPMVDNVTFVEECRLAGRTQYYWYRNALDITTSIDESGGLLWHLCLVLLLSWIVVFLCMMRGVISAGKVNAKASLYFSYNQGTKPLRRVGVKTLSLISQFFALLLIRSQTFLFCLSPGPPPCVRAFFQIPAVDSA